MSEVIQNLRKARLQLVSQRADLAKVLAAPFDRQQTSDALQTFEQIQKTIEAIDAAIKDEANRFYWTEAP
jgi:hypothetical protein